MWIAWIVLSNIGIFILEYAYRQGSYTSFITALPTIIIPMIMGQVGLFYGFRSAPSLLIAGATFTLINVGLRVINTYMLGESINNWNWLGIVFMVSGMLLLKIR